MRTSDVMMRTPASCTPDMNLGSVVEILWNRNCGILPVVDSQDRVVSVITDRDICIALGTRNRTASDVTVGEVATHVAACCRANEDIQAALIQMAEAKVRRLPVVDADGKLEGILSMDDIVERTLLSSTAKSEGLTSQDVVKTLQRLYAPQLPAVVKKATAG
jgi:CBS domain-containing protein